MEESHEEVWLLGTEYGADTPAESFLKALLSVRSLETKQSLEKMNSLLHKNEDRTIDPKSFLEDGDQPTYCAQDLQFYYSYLYL